MVGEKVLDLTAEAVAREPALRPERYLGVEVPTALVLRRLRDQGAKPLLPEVMAGLPDVDPPTVEEMLEALQRPS